MQSEQSDWTKLDQVEIQIASWCNRSCHFCPSGTFPTPKVGMSMEMVDRIISLLEPIDFSGTIGLHLMCEPLMHKKIFDIIQEFRTRLPRTFIRLESNGDALKNIERLGWLFDRGLNEILINCYDSQQQFNTLNRAISDLRPASGPIWYWNRWQRNPLQPKPEWRVVRVRDFSGTGYSLKNWAGHVDKQKPEAVELPLHMGCDRPFQRLHVNYLGQVVLCNMDWKFEVVAGELRTQTIEEIWNTPLLLNYRRNLLAKNRNMPLCRRCDSGAPTPVQPGYPPADPWVSWRARWLDWSRRWRRVFQSRG